MMTKNEPMLLSSLDTEIRSDRARVWILQANPKWYRLLDALKDRRLVNDVWEVNQYKNEIQSGHIGIIWMAGKEAGIYAIVRITSNPQLLVDSEASTKYWTYEEDKLQKRLRVKIKFILNLVNMPIWKKQLESVSGLENLSILNRPRGTNFPVTKSEWLIMSELIEENLKTHKL